jgi:hypothetical protein
MSTHIFSAPIVETFRSGVTGETFTISAATKPSGASWTGPTIASVGSGAYTATVVPDMLGVWQATWVGNTSGKLFSGTWEIVAPPAAKYTRRATGNTIAANDVNELQESLETVERMLGLS